PRAMEVEQHGSIVVRRVRAVQPERARSAVHLIDARFLGSFRLVNLEVVSLEEVLDEIAFDLRVRSREDRVVDDRGGLRVQYRQDEAVVLRAALRPREDANGRGKNADESTKVDRPQEEFVRARGRKP